MLGGARFRWSAGSVSALTLIVFHVVLNCPCKWKYPIMDNGQGFRPLQLLGQTLVRFLYSLMLLVGAEIANEYAWRVVGAPCCGALWSQHSVGQGVAEREQSSASGGAALPRLGHRPAPRLAHLARLAT